MRVAMTAADVLGCGSKPILRAAVLAPSSKSADVLAVQQLLLFGRRGPDSTTYAAKVLEALAEAEPAALARAVLSTPGVTATLSHIASDNAASRIMSILAGLPYPASSSMFRMGKLHPSDPTELGVAIASLLHPLASEEGSLAEDAMTAEFQSDGAATMLVTAVQASRSRPGAGVFVLRDAMRGMANPGGEDAALAAKEGEESRLGVATALQAAKTGTSGAFSDRLASCTASHPSFVQDDVQLGDLPQLQLTKRLRSGPAGAVIARAAVASAVGATLLGYDEASVGEFHVLPTGPGALQAATALANHCVLLGGGSPGGLLVDGRGASWRRECPAFLRHCAGMDPRGAMDFGDRPGLVDALRTAQARGTRDAPSAGSMESRMFGSTTSSKLSAIEACVILIQSRCALSLAFSESSAAAAFPFRPSGSAPPPPAMLPVPSRAGSPKLGSTALHAIRLLCAIARSPWDEPAAALRRSGGLAACLDAVEAFPWQSLVHSTVTDCIIDLLRHGSAPMQRHLILDCDLAARLARMLRSCGALHRLNDVRRPRAAPTKPAGYSGMCLRVAASLDAALGRADSEMPAGGFSELPTDVTARLKTDKDWHWVATGPLAVSLVLQGEMIGAPPSASNSSGRPRNPTEGGKPNVDEVDFPAKG
jgi:hypothetical protein